MIVWPVPKDLTQLLGMFNSSFASYAVLSEIQKPRLSKVYVVSYSFLLSCSREL